MKPLGLRELGLDMGLYHILGNRRWFCLDHEGSGQHVDATFSGQAHHLCHQDAIHLQDNIFQFRRRHVKVVELEGLLNAIDNVQISRSIEESNVTALHESVGG